MAKLEKLKWECSSVRSTQVRPDLLFRDWLNEWYQNDAKPRLRPTTQLQYEGFLQHHLIPSLGEIPLNQLTQGELQQFFRHMKESGRKVQVERYGTGIPLHEVEALARILLPEIQAFFESEEGQREFAEWKAQQEQDKEK